MPVPDAGIQVAPVPPHLAWPEVCDQQTPRAAMVVPPVAVRFAPRVEVERPTEADVGEERVGANCVVNDEVAVYTVPIEFVT